MQASVLKDERPSTGNEVKVEATILVWTEALAGGQSCMRSMPAAGVTHVIHRHESQAVRQLRADASTASQ